MSIPTVTAALGVEDPILLHPCVLSVLPILLHPCVSSVLVVGLPMGFRGSGCSYWSRSWRGGGSGGPYSSFIGGLRAGVVGVRVRRSSGAAGRPYLQLPTR